MHNPLAYIIHRLDPRTMAPRPRKPYTKRTSRDVHQMLAAKVERHNKRVVGMMEHYRVDDLVNHGILTAKEARAAKRILAREHTIH